MNRRETIELIDKLPAGQKSTPGKRLRLLRKHFGFSTQADLAEALTKRGANVQHSTISRLENDDLQPSLDTLEAAADEFGVSLDWLRCRSDKIATPPEVKSVAQMIESLPSSVCAEALAEFSLICERMSKASEANHSEWLRLFALIERIGGTDLRRKIEWEMGVAGPDSIEKLSANIGVIVGAEKVTA